MRTGPTVGGVRVAILTESDANGGETGRRVAEADGFFPIQAPPETTYWAIIYDPQTDLIAYEINVAPSGQEPATRYRSEFGASIAPDTDGDGLPDDIEFVLGPDPSKTDSNRDGIDDFMSIARGIDPSLPNFETGQVDLADLQSSQKP